MSKSDGYRHSHSSNSEGGSSRFLQGQSESAQSARETEGPLVSSSEPNNSRSDIPPDIAPDDAEWGDVDLTQVEPESISSALARTQPSLQLGTGTIEVASVGALRQLVEHLNRERIKVQELMSSLSFALRSFNNVNQILELIPLVSSRIADASGAALVLFEGTGDIKISRMFCSEGGDCSRIKQALERAVESVISEFEASPGGQPPRDMAKTAAYSTDAPTSPSLKLADSFEQLLDERVGVNLGGEVQLFGTSLLSRNVIRGRLYVFSHQPDYMWNAERQKLIRLVADQTAVALENDSLSLELRYRSRIAQEIAIGSEIQQRLQPQRCPTISGLEIAARSESASPVGGDYYDFVRVPVSAEELPTDGVPADNDSSSTEQHQLCRWGIAIGDVMGKGVPAGLLMMATRGVLRAEVLHNREPAQILRHLNRVTHSDMENSRRFVSLFYSDFCPVTRQLRYSNAAHNPCLWWQAATETVSTLDTDGMLIGVDSESQYGQNQVTLNSGDVVLYYTDGVTEAVNPKGDRFEEAGLVRALKGAASNGDGAQDILDRLFEQVRQFRQGLEGIQFRDDMTVVVIKVCPTAE
ncbi:MAG: PP2C family protein-serine/threonine phosphatase [Synechococcus sp.]